LLAIYIVKEDYIVMDDFNFDFDFEFDDVATEEFDDADDFNTDTDYDFDDDDLPDFGDEEFDDPTFEDAYDASALTEAAEAAIFMDTVRESFDNDADFVAYVAENAVEWELYGLIPSASRALEAIKTIKVDDWKVKNRQRLIRRECIRIACKNNDPNYAKYKKFRDNMRTYRQKIFDKYENKAKANVLKARNNSVAKASNIKTTSGANLTNRVRASKSESERGKDPTNAPKKSKAS
jgi:hypothetical protein